LLLSSLVLGALVVTAILARRPGLAPLRKGAVGFGAMLVAAQAIVVSTLYLPSLRASDPIVRGNALAIVRGVASDQAIRSSHHPNPRAVREGIEVLRMLRFAWYRELLDGAAPTGSVDYLDGHPLTDAIVAAGSDCVLEGWAVRSETRGGPVKGVLAFLDGREVARAELDLPRPDVARAHGDAAFAKSGWRMVIPASALGRAPRHLRVAAEDYNGGTFTLGEAIIATAADGSVRPPAADDQLGAPGPQPSKLPAQ
jgi:hypothetical protein